MYYHLGSICQSLAALDACSIAMSGLSGTTMDMLVGITTWTTGIPRYGPVGIAHSTGKFGSCVWSQSLCLKFKTCACFQIGTSSLLFDFCGSAYRMSVLSKAQTGFVSLHTTGYPCRPRLFSSRFRSRRVLARQRPSYQSCRVLAEQQSAFEMLGKEQSYALLLSTLAGLSTSIGGAAAVCSLLGSPFTLPRESTHIEMYQ